MIGFEPLSIEVLAEYHWIHGYCITHSNSRPDIGGTRRYRDLHCINLFRE